MLASASIVLKAGIDYSEHGLHGLHGLLSVESGQSVVLLRGRFAQNLKKIFFKIIQICLILGLILADFEAARPTLLSITKGCFEHGLHRLNGLAICRILSICGRFGFFFFQWLCGDNEHNCKFFYAIQLFCVHLQFQP